MCSQSRLEWREIASASIGVPRSLPTWLERNAVDHLSSGAAQKLSVLTIMSARTQSAEAAFGVRLHNLTSLLQYLRQRFGNDCQFCQFHKGLKVPRLQSLYYWYR